MYIMYIDESGDTIKLENKGKHHLVLAGCIVKDVDKVSLEQKFRDIKMKYFSKPDIEVKSNFLRYANPDIAFESPLKLSYREKYDELEREITTFLVEAPTKLLAAVIDKDKYWSKHPNSDPYHRCYISLLYRFQVFLEEVEDFGICIIDPREGRVDKNFIGNDLDKLHNYLRWEMLPISKLSNSLRVIERLLFSTSDKNVGIQIADLYCYPIFHIYEYSKKPENYWRFTEITSKKLLKVNHLRMSSIEVL